MDIDWIGSYLDRLMNANAWAQDAPLGEMQKLRPSFTQPDFIGSAQSKNIEDRRGNFTEQDRVNALWDEEYQRVRRALTNSILRRPQSATDAYPMPEDPQLSINQIVSTVLNNLK